MKYLVKRLRNWTGHHKLVTTSDMVRSAADMLEYQGNKIEQQDAYILKLESENAELRKDTERVNWLAQNFFHREMNDFDARILKRGETSNQWVFFAPKEIQGDIRDVLDAAMQKEQA